MNRSQTSVDRPTSQPARQGQWRQACLGMVLMAAAGLSACGQRGPLVRADAATRAAPAQADAAASATR